MTDELISALDGLRTFNLSIDKAIAALDEFARVTRELVSSSEAKLTPEQRARYDDLRTRGAYILPALIAAADGSAAAMEYALASADPPRDDTT